MWQIVAMAAVKVMVILYCYLVHPLLFWCLWLCFLAPCYYLPVPHIFTYPHLSPSPPLLLLIHQQEIPNPLPPRLPLPMAMSTILPPVCLCLSKIRSSDVQHCPMDKPFCCCAKVRHNTLFPLIVSTNTVSILFSDNSHLNIDLILILIIYTVFLLLPHFFRISKLSGQVLWLTSITMSNPHCATAIDYR